MATYQAQSSLDTGSYLVKLNSSDVLFTKSTGTSSDTDCLDYLSKDESKKGGIL